MSAHKSSKKHRSRRLRAAYLIEAAAILLFAVLCVCAYLLRRTPDPVRVSDDYAPFELSMLNVGQGLSILIRSGDQYMLYDGGGPDYSAHVTEYLKNAGVKRLKYVVASHHDADHIAGLIDVVREFPVDNVLIADYEADTWTSERFLRAVTVSGATLTRPAAGDTFSLNDAECEVLGPEDYEAEIENNRSIVIRIIYGDISILITGDAEYSEESELISSGRTLRSDLYIVGHHGSSWSSSAEFIDSVRPKYAFLSVGADNDFGHPSERTMDTLRSMGIALFRTDKQGDLVFGTDGTNCWFNVAPSDDWSGG